MALATITSKGQVTIPKNIRESLHLHEGDKIEFVLNDQGEAVMKPITKKIDDLFGILNNPRRKTLSVDEMNSAISKRMKNI